MFVEIENLTFKYKNTKVDTVNNFTLGIKKGEIVAILGPSGSGKSTVLRLLSGLEVPDGGVIRINNLSIADEQTFIPPEKRGIGMVFQDYALFPHMTVRENILFGLNKLSKQDKNERLDEVLELVNLTDYVNRYPYELSGGQQQRVALARAIAPRPSLLLLDEPFSNLDASLRTKIRSELKEIIKTTEITSIFVTHDLEDAKNIADWVVILKKGLIQKIEKPQVIFEECSNLNI